MVVRTSTTPLNFNEVDSCFGCYRTINPPLRTRSARKPWARLCAPAGSKEWLGRRVVATAAGALGAHAQEVLADADMTFDAPDSLDDIQAAAFFFPFHVGHLALVERGHLQPAQTLLVHAGAGGVGSAAVQLGASPAVPTASGSTRILSTCSVQAASAPSLAVPHRGPSSRPSSLAPQAGPPSVAPCSTGAPDG
jgi:hypothetical protein